MNGVGVVTAIGIYLICWWIVLFAVLPIGMNQGAQDRPTDGADWGAPANPNLKRKFLTTTWVAGVVWAAVMAVLVFGLVPLPGMPGPNG